MKLRTLSLLVALSVSSFSAWAKEVTIAYQTGAEPAKVAQADGEYEKTTGWQINWRRFDTGADVITALASGNVQIGNVGSSPLSAAASRQLPIQTIFVAALIGDAEALVARADRGIKTPEDLIGKKIAVPFVSTSHYSLLSALKHWNIDPSKVQILNLRPPEISAAWKRGDIDATYVWGPALSEAKRNGAVLTDSAQIAEWGAPTFDTWIARQDFIQANPDFISQFVQVTEKTYADYRKNPEAWIAQSSNLEKIAKLIGANPQDVPDLLRGNVFPIAEEQRSERLLGGGIAKAIKNTASFLLEQKKVDKVLEDYSLYVNAQFVQPRS